MAAQKPPLDEVVYRRPEIIEWWLRDPTKNGIPPPWQWMEERFIHRYFTESEFFDWTSKNGLLFEQSKVNQETFELVHSRQRLEATIRKRPGLEFVIMHEPEPAKKGPGVEDGDTTDVWVLRKQERSNEQVPGKSTKDDPYPKTEVRGTYYIVNENAYQAPSVADVVGNRMLSAVMSLEKMFGTSKDLSSFTPMTGHTYLPPTSSKAAATACAQGSPNRSREGSVAPGMAVDTQSLRSGSVAADSQVGGAQASDDILATRLLVNSLQQTASYGDEYMDENPLIGEPGNFKFTSSTAAVKKRKADEEAAIIAAQKARELKENASRATSPKPPVNAPTPPLVFTEAKAVAKTEKERKEERKRRRKSRPNAGTATSPTTPKSATSAMATSASG